MENIFRNIKFKYPFREYQQRALDEINQYLGDEKINVIAAPGAGKTILALQVMINLKSPTLILVPTVALREQWIVRLKNDFTYNFNIDDYISDDIFLPNLITVSTYQAIHSICSKRTEKNQNINITEILNSVNIKTIILDEAHHLKTAWLDSIQEIIKGISNVKIISLTATPPYDAEKLHWNKYVELCGEPDVEVTVAELVKRGDLAPHQDYIFFNDLSENQIKELKGYQEEINIFLKDVLNDVEFITSLATVDMVIKPDENKKYIIENFDYYLSVLKLLKLKNIEFPNSTNIELDRYRFSIENIETILSYTLFNDKKSYKGFGNVYRKIKRRLNEIGAINANKVNLRYTSQIEEIITENTGKLESIKEILKNEKSVMSEKLKAVIITEHIRKDLLDIDEYMKFIGVIPIFKSLIKDYYQIVLTGEIIIIPTYLRELLLKICARENINTKDITIEELISNFDYSTVNFLSAKKKAVSVITELFRQSDVNVLVGTNALIGEGWDAPFINTLIMASSVAAYVTTNQVRGRVIRKDKLDLKKCANIWHLATVERYSNNRFMLGEDFDILKRRFDGFEGVDTRKKDIHYGIYRLGIEERIYEEQELNLLNNEMLNMALNRDIMAADWENALENYVPTRKCEIKTQDIGLAVMNSEKISTLNMMEVYNESNMYLNDKFENIGKMRKEIKNKSKEKTKRNGIMIGGSLLICIWARILGVPFLIFSGTCELLNQLTYRTRIENLRNKLIRKKQDYKNERNKNIIQRNAERLINALKEMKLINDKAILIFNESDSSFFLKKANLKENSLFLQALTELLSDIDNPRYIITNGIRTYQVPTIIGKNKENVEILARNIFPLQRKVAIIFTRTSIGESLLIKLKLGQANFEKAFDGKVVNEFILDKNKSEIDISNEEINISMSVMKDVLKSKNLLEEEE